MAFQNWQGGEQGFNQPDASRQPGGRQYPAGQQNSGENQAMPPGSGYYPPPPNYPSPQYPPPPNYPPPYYPPPPGSGAPRSWALSLLESVTPREQGGLKKTIFVAGMLSGLVIAGSWKLLAKGGVKLGVKAGRKLKELSMQVKEDIEDLTAEAVEEVTKYDETKKKE